VVGGRGWRWVERRVEVDFWAVVGYVSNYTFSVYFAFIEDSQGAILRGWQ